MKTTSHLFAKMIGELSDHESVLSDDTAALSATVFILSEGASFWNDLCNDGYNPDGFNGWAVAFSSMELIEATGDHFSFFENDHNVLLLAKHLQGLAI